MCVQKLHRPAFWLQQRSRNTSKSVRIVVGSAVDRNICPNRLFPALQLSRGIFHANKLRFQVTGDNGGMLRGRPGTMRRGIAQRHNSDRNRRCLPTSGETRAKTAVRPLSSAGHCLAYVSRIVCDLLPYWTVSGVLYWLLFVKSYRKGRCWRRTPPRGCGLLDRDTQPRKTGTVPFGARINIAT